MPPIIPGCFDIVNIYGEQGGGHITKRRRTCDDILRALKGQHVRGGLMFKPEEAGIAWSSYFI